MAELSGFALLLPGGGCSRRFGGGNKLFAPLCGMPVFVRTIRTLAPLFPENAVFMAVAPESLPEAEAAARRNLPEVPIRFIPGGATRTGSVRNLALAASEQGGFDFIAIHDAVRPLIRPEVVIAAAELCRRTGAAVVCRKVTDTLKQSADGAVIDGTVSRECMWAAETPQMFRLSDFLGASAEAEADGGVFTDDAQMMERFSGLRAGIVPDPYPNPKITFAEDLAFCRALLAEQDPICR